jgi:hypothetical protein
MHLTETRRAQIAQHRAQSRALLMHAVEVGRVEGCIRHARRIATTDGRP